MPRAGGRAVEFPKLECYQEDLVQAVKPVYDAIRMFEAPDETRILAASPRLPHPRSEPVWLRRIQQHGRPIWT